MLSLSVIVRDPPPDPKLRETVGRALMAWRGSLGLNLIPEGTRTDEPQVSIDAWSDTTNPAVEVDLVCDDELRCRYLSVIAEDADLRWRMYEQLCRDFAVETVDSLCAAVERDGDADPAAYVRLALGSNGGFDTRACELISAGLRAPQARTRAQAAMAAALVGWPALADIAEAVGAAETDPGVARLLSVATASCRSGRA